MCKLMMVLGSKDNENLKVFLYNAGINMSKAEKDGIGFTAVKDDGEIFTQRWHKNHEFQLEPDKLTTETFAKYQSFVDLSKAEESISMATKGEVDWDTTRSVIMHTRMATCGKEFANVHPFVDNENITSIIHNGVISNHSEMKKLNSTCDSEVILTKYNELKVNENPKKISDLVNALKGYWAVGVVSKVKNRRIIDIFRGATNGTYNYDRTGGSATLYGTYVKQLQAVVFCTRKEIIQDTMEMTGWEHAQPFFPVNNATLLRLDALTGEVILVDDYKSRLKVEVTTPVVPATSNLLGFNRNRRRGSTNGNRTNKHQALSMTASYLDKDPNEYVEDCAVHFFGKTIGDYIEETKNEDVQSTDSKYFQSMSEEEIAHLEDVSNLLSDEENKQLDDLPKELRVAVLLNMVTENR